MKHRFFVDGKYIVGEKIALIGDNAAHAAVLRLAIGEEIVICDGNAMDYHCVVAACGKLETKAKILHKMPNIAELPIAITLYQALPKTGRMDDIVNDCTQLGVSHIVPILTARCMAKTSDRDVKKIARWQKIAQSAASQSGRGRIPHINDVMLLEAALEDAKKHGSIFVCYENEEKLALKAFLADMPEDLSSIAFFIGSEGGFADDEIAKFKESGVAVVSLGPRILRTELAGAVVLANLTWPGMPPKGG